MLRNVLFLFVSTFSITFAQTPKTMKELLQTYHFETKSVTLKDGELAYVKEGKGKKVLVFLHGLSSNSDAWYRNIEELKKDYTCYAIDLPGFGKSYKNAPAFTPTYFAEVLNEFSEKMKLKKFTLVGHSMGGQAAVKFAALYPNKLKNLILVAPAGIEYFTEAEGNMMMMVTTKEGVMNTSDDQIDRNYAINFHEMPKEAASMIQDRKTIKNSSDFEAHAEAIVASIKGMLDDKVIDDLPKIKQPTLLLFGKNDFLIPNRYFHKGMTIDDVAEKAKKSISNSEFLMINEAGHFLMFEKPTEVNNAIKAFLK